MLHAGQTWLPTQAGVRCHYSASNNMLQDIVQLQVLVFCLQKVVFTTQIPDDQERIACPMGEMPTAGKSEASHHLWSI